MHSQSCTMGVPLFQYRPWSVLYCRAALSQYVLACGVLFAQKRSVLPLVCMVRVLFCQYNAEPDMHGEIECNVLCGMQSPTVLSVMFCGELVPTVLRGTCSVMQYCSLPVQYTTQAFRSHGFCSHSNVRHSLLFRSVRLHCLCVGHPGQAMHFFICWSQTHLSALYFSPWF